MVTRTKKIFVGGVSASTTEDDLTNYFKKFGTVSTRCKEKATIFENNTLRNGPDKIDSNNGNKHVGMKKRC